MTIWKSIYNISFKFYLCFLISCFKEKILIDPHTAVAIGANNKIALTGKNIILATAHPSKFYNTVVKETGIKPELPENLKDILLKKEKYEKLPKDLKVVQKYILKNI